MIYAFLVLVLGSMLLGGAWSFHRQQKPLWTSILMAVLAVGCIVIALWRIQQG